MYMFLTVRMLMKSCVFIKPMSFTSFTKILVFLLLHKIHVYIICTYKYLYNKCILHNVHVHVSSTLIHAHVHVSSNTDTCIYMAVPYKIARVHMYPPHLYIYMCPPILVHAHVHVQLHIRSQYMH